MSSISEAKRNDGEGPKTEVASFFRVGKGNIRAMIDEYEGETYVSIRLWFFDPATGRERPSNQGVHLHSSEAIQLVEALRPHLKAKR